MAAPAPLTHIATHHQPRSGTVPSNIIARNFVTEIPPAPARDAVDRFAGLLTFETDCWDVHHALSRSDPGFVLFDVRSPEMYGKGHIQSAVNLPHRRIDATTLGGYAPETIFVVYCAGPHCNGADRAALRIAQLGRPVKKLIGGVTGWLDEGFALVQRQG
jgi:rhodanese-related sulfurtransferase